MPDDVILNEPTTTGKTVRTEDIGGKQYQVVKVAIGVDGIDDGDISATNPMPVTGTVDIDTSTLATAANQVIGNTSLNNIDTKIPVQGQAAMDSSLPVVIANNQSAVPVSGVLTDAELRATPVPISGTVTANTGLTQPLTDTQLRATPVPISGTVSANTGLSQPLTDTQLRASAVPVSIAPPSLPYNNKVTVTTAANRVQLSSGLAVKSVTIKAGLSNTGVIYVGDSTVSASNGFELAAGDSVSMDIDNLNTIYIDASVNSQYVTYVAVN